MKLKLIALAAMLAAGSAHAAIDNGGSTNGTGELFLVVSDTTAGYSFVGDLGMSMDSFLSASSTSNSWNLGGFSAWNTFVTTIGGDLTNAKYSVYALDNVGATTTVDAKRLLTTVAAGDDVTSYSTANNKVGAAVGGTVQTTLGNMQVDANNLMNDHDTLANGSSYTSSAKALAYADGQLGDYLKNNMPFMVTVAASDTADFWLLGNSSSATLAQADLYKQAGQFSLSGTTLAYSVAAVPEADTYALMLAGLGLVGFMVRRRKA